MTGPARLISTARSNPVACAARSACGVPLARVGWTLAPVVAFAGLLAVFQGCDRSPPPPPPAARTQPDMQGVAAGMDKYAKEDPAEPPAPAEPGKSSDPAATPAPPPAPASPEAKPSPSAPPAKPPGRG